MNGWNRLFVIVAIVWVLVAPFLFVGENNKPAERIYSMCNNNAYLLYGSSDSTTLNMDRYRAEGAKCMERFMQSNLISWPGTLSAMVGLGDFKLGAIAWGFILIPLALLWIIAWGVGRVVRWVAAGSHRETSHFGSPTRRSAHRLRVQLLVQRLAGIDMQRAFGGRQIGADQVLVDLDQLGLVRRRSRATVTGTSNRFARDLADQPAADVAAAVVCSLRETDKKPPPGRSRRRLFSRSRSAENPLPPHSDSIDAAVRIATGVMTHSSARNRTRPEHDACASNASPRIPLVCAVHDRLGWRWIECEAC